MIKQLPNLMQAIEELPGQESPEIFGLHPNADLTFRTLQVQAAVQIIMDTQPKGAGGGGGLSREEIVDRICEDLLSKVSNTGGTSNILQAALSHPLSRLNRCDMKETFSVNERLSSSPYATHLSCTCDKSRTSQTASLQ